MKSMRIKSKITAVAFISILLSVGLSGFSIYLYVNPILSRQIVRDNQTIVAKIAQQVSYQLEDIVNYAKGIVVNDQLQLLLKKMSTTEGFDYYMNNLQLETVLKEYSVAFGPNRKGSISRAPVSRQTSRSGNAMLPDERLRLPRRYTMPSLTSKGRPCSSFRSSIGRASSAYAAPPVACAACCIVRGSC